MNPVIVAVSLVLGAITATVYSDNAEQKTNFFNITMHCALKYQLKNFPESPQNLTRNQKCAVACMLEGMGCLEIVDGKPQLIVEGIEEMEKIMESPSEELAATVEAAKKCNVESASIADECEYAAAAMVCMEQEEDIWKKSLKSERH